MNRIVAATLFGILAPFSQSFAGCESRASLDKTHAIARGSSGSELVTCEPKQGSDTEVLVAYIQDLGNHQFATISQVVDRASAVVIAEYSDAADPYLNGIGDPSSIEIEQGPYIISESVTAFGLRVRYSLNSWDSTEVLSLYVQTGKRLNRILEGVMVAFSTSQFCYSNVVSTSVSTIPREGREFNDLVVREDSTSYEGALGDDGQCSVSEPITLSEKSRYQFVGGAYKAVGSE